MPVVVVTSVLAALAAALHVLIFVMEAVWFPHRPDVQARFRTHPDDVEAVRPWAYNQGFYNLFLALGALAGVVVMWAGDLTTGLALVLLACGSMLAAALVLVLTDHRMARAAATQGTVPALAVISALITLSLFARGLS